MSGVNINRANAIDSHASCQVIWATELRHKSTGEALGLTEYKATALVRVSDLEVRVIYACDVYDAYDYVPYLYVCLP